MKNPHIFPIPLRNWAIFEALEALGGGLQKFFQLQKQRNNLWRLDLLWILTCSLTSLSSLVRKFRFLLQKTTRWPLLERRDCYAARWLLREAKRFSRPCGLVERSGNHRRGQNIVHVDSQVVESFPRRLPRNGLYLRRRFPRNGIFPRRLLC